MNWQFMAYYLDTEHQIDARGLTRSVASSTCYRKHNMRWETPCAFDFRFGMEITMYIASR